MKIHPLTPLIIVACFAFLLSACGSNPAWTRTDDSEDPMMNLAEQACQCIYDILDDQEDISAYKVTEEADAWAKAVRGQAGDQSQIAETMKILDMNPTLTELVDESPCMEPIEEEMFNRGADFEDLMKLIDENCKLSPFYN